METNETELLLCQAYVFVTVHLTLSLGTPQLYKSLPTSCNKSLPVLAWEGEFSGKLRGIGSGGDVQGLRLPPGPALPSGG